MLKKTFERTIRELCEDVLSEPTPEALPDRIIDHLQNTFPVQWSTLWLTEQMGIDGGKRLRLAAASGDAKKLLRAENGGPAVYEFGEGLTGEIAERQKTVNLVKFETVASLPGPIRRSLGRNRENRHGTRSMPASWPPTRRTA